MSKYNHEKVIADAIECIPHCVSLRELAEKIDVPESSLRDILRKAGHNFASITAIASDASEEDARVLRLQIHHYKQLAEHYRSQLDNRRWMRDEFAALIAPSQPLTIPKGEKKNGKMREQVPVLLCSDIHYGLDVPEGQLGVLGTYNPKMASARIFYTFKTFASIAKHQSFPIRRARVYLLGDAIEHSEMRPIQTKQVSMHVIKQTKEVADLLAGGLQFLCGEFEEVEVYAVPGNHGRATAKAGDNLPDETFEHLIYYIIEKTLAQQRNFKIHVPEAWYFIDEIFSWKFLGLHCEDVLSYVGLPWYGIERLVKDYYMMLAQVSLSGLREMNPTEELSIMQFLNLLKMPDHVCIGHFHNRILWDIMGIELTANGTMSGATIYSAKRLRRLSRPRQMMFFVHPEHGAGLNCPIDLSRIR